MVQIILLLVAMVLLSLLCQINCLSTVVREQGAVQVTISGVDWQNTIELLVGREVLQVFLVGVKFRIVGRTVQNPCRTLNTRHPVLSCSYQVRRVMFSKLENLNRTRKWREQYREPGSFPERGKIAGH